MPLVFKDTVAHGSTLGIWKKEETLDLLESVYILSKSEEAAYQKITNEGRKQEWLITRILLTEILESRTEINYNELGSPYLENSFLNLSISHSKNFVSILSSKFYKPGVDIEHISARTQKVKHKFLNSDELSWCVNDKLLTMAWSVKEAIFKIFEKELDFHDVLILENKMPEDKGLIEAVVNKPGSKREFSVSYMLIEEDILTYTLASI